LDDFGLLGRASDKMLLRWEDRLLARACAPLAHQELQQRGATLRGVSPAAVVRPLSDEGIDVASDHWRCVGSVIRNLESALAEALIVGQEPHAGLSYPSLSATQEEPRLAREREAVDAYFQERLPAVEEHLTVALGSLVTLDIVGHRCAGSRVAPALMVGDLALKNLDSDVIASVLWSTAASIEDVLAPLVSAEQRSRLRSTFHRAVRLEGKELLRMSPAELAALPDPFIAIGRSDALALDVQRQLLRHVRDCDPSCRLFADWTGDYRRRNKPHRCLLHDFLCSLSDLEAAVHSRLIRIGAKVGFDTSSYSSGAVERLPRHGRRRYR
jgi:hypothetical protein